MFNDNVGGAKLYFLSSGNYRIYNAHSPLSLIFIYDSNNIWLIVVIRNSNDSVLKYKLINFFSISKFIRVPNDNY